MITTTLTNVTGLLKGFNEVNEHIVPGTVSAQKVGAGSIFFTLKMRKSYRGSETCLLGKYELGSFLFQSLNSCHTCCQYATCFCVNMILWSLFWLLSLGCSSFVFLPSMLVSQPIKAEEGDGARFLDRIFCFQLIPSGVLQSMRCLPCCFPWGCKKSDKTEWLSWSDTC